MGSVWKDPEVQPSKAEPPEARGTPAEHWGLRYSEESFQERPHGLWKRLKAWFARPAPKRDSYVSNVVNPDDRRYIPRR